MLRAQSGDREAFDLLLAELAPLLVRYVTPVTSDPALAQDVVQETLITVVRKLAWLNDPSLFRPWAYRIASREAFRALRKRRVDVSIEEHLGADYEQPDPWQRERVLASVERLAPGSRAVITLHYLEELTLAEVAAVLDLGINTVKSRLAYGLAQLRKSQKG